MDLANLAYSCIISGDSDGFRMDLETAKVTLYEWNKENPGEGYDEIIPEQFVTIYNEILDFFMKGRENNA